MMKYVKMPPTASEPWFPEWFWARTSTVNDCLEWTGPKSGGYGKFKIGKHWREYRAHRVAYFLGTGVDPEGLHVCHRCDNPSCVKPDHLFLGTDYDNMQDKIAKGRSRGGEQKGASNGNARLTEDMARQVFAMIEAGKSNGEISHIMPVGHSMVSRMRHGKAWSYLNV